MQCSFAIFNRIVFSYLYLSLSYLGIYLEYLFAEGLELELRTVLPHKEDRTVDNFVVDHPHRLEIVLQRVPNQNGIIAHDGFQEGVEFVL